MKNYTTLFTYSILIPTNIETLITNGITYTSNSNNRIISDNINITTTVLQTLQYYLKAKEKKGDKINYFS